MAMNVPAASASAAVSEAKATAILPLRHHSVRPNSSVSFAFSPKLKSRFFAKGTSGSSHTVAVKAHLNEVALDAPSNAAASPLGSLAQESNTEKPEKDEPPTPVSSATEESITQFITQIKSLVELVDSRDIVELQMKQHDCELLIRKKEAIEPTIVHAPAPMMMQSPPPPTYAQVGPPPPAPTPTPTPAPSAPPPAPTPAAPKPAKSIPPLKSPMAGTFYRSPAPGAPPFVKVGDKVQKGQILCIVEAMKLMNEIESDRSGTIVEILLDDGKPVSFDTPLFLIQP